MAEESLEHNIKPYIEGAEYPTKTRNLMAFAEDEGGAPAEVVDRLNQLPSQHEFSDPDEVVEMLETAEESNR